jgi:hypothetical protein
MGKSIAFRYAYPLGSSVALKELARVQNLIFEAERRQKAREDGYPNGYPNDHRRIT